MFIVQSVILYHFFRAFREWMHLIRIKFKFLFGKIQKLRKKIIKLSASEFLFKQPGYLAVLTGYVCDGDRKFRRKKFRLEQFCRWQCRPTTVSPRDSFAADGFAVDSFAADSFAASSFTADSFTASCFTWTTPLKSIFSMFQIILSKEKNILFGTKKHFGLRKLKKKRKIFEKVKKLPRRSRNVKKLSRTVGNVKNLPRRVSAEHRGCPRASAGHLCPRTLVSQWLERPTCMLRFPDSIPLSDKTFVCSGILTIGICWLRLMPFSNHPPGRG